MTPPDDDQLADELGRALRPEVPPIDPARVAALADLARSQAAAETGEVVPLPSRRSLLRLGAVAAGGVAAGATGVFLFVDDDTPAPPPTEEAAVRTTPGVEASARLIAHTWGMEVLLDVSGLEPGARYEMAFVAADGRRLGAGGFVGADGLMRCRNNGPLLRAEATGFVVTGPDGREPVVGDLA